MYTKLFKAQISFGELESENPRAVAEQAITHFLELLPQGIDVQITDRDGNQRTFTVKRALTPPTDPTLK